MASAWKHSCPSVPQKPESKARLDQCVPSGVVKMPSSLPGSQVAGAVQSSSIAAYTCAPAVASTMRPIGSPATPSTWFQVRPALNDR